MVYRAEWALSENNFRLTHPDEPPPQVPAQLSEFWRFQRYGLPPLAGGMRDQPVGWFEQGETLVSAYNAWTAWMQGDKSAKWKEEHRDILPLIKWLRETVYGGR